MSKVVYEAKPQRYVVEQNYEQYNYNQSPAATGVFKWTPIRSFEDLYWAKDYADSRARKYPDEEFRVVDTEADDGE